MIPLIIFLILIVAAIVLLFSGLTSLALKRNAGIELVFSVICMILALLMYLIFDGFGLF